MASEPTVLAGRVMVARTMLAAGPFREALGYSTKAVTQALRGSRG